MDVAFEGIPFINPTLIMAFITFFATGGYILEKSTHMTSLLVAVISAVTSMIIVSILQIFVLGPLKRSEHSMTESEQSLKGKVGKVIITIPKDGFGEILVSSLKGTIAKTAKTLHNDVIENGTEVVIIDIKPGYVVVIPSEDKAQEEKI
ncbi:NfeD family protein [[Brevibacterium] frigoritolerans]|nr:NfeD family protein [Peribacillus frigoritolerans]